MSPGLSRGNAMNKQDATAKLLAWLRAARKRLGATATYGEARGYIRTHHAAEIAQSPMLTEMLDPAGAMAAELRRQHAAGRIDDRGLDAALEVIREVEAEFAEQDAKEEMTRRAHKPSERHH